MSMLPPTPVSPREFVEDVVPSLFAEADLSDADRAAELRVGVCLLDEGGRPGAPGAEGGEWTLHFVEGELGIESGRTEDCDLTFVQRVADWRAALWEGRPALVADLVHRADRDEAGSTPPAGLPAPPGPGALEPLRELRGRVDVIVAGASAAEDWRLGVLVGPGPIPEDAQATVRIGADEAEAIRRGELHPLEALITGRLRLEGDLGLILQIQAIAMASGLPSARRR